MEGLEVSVQAIADTNRKLAQFAEGVRQPSLAVTAEQMSTVLAEIVRMGEWTRTGLVNNVDCRLAEELDRYRSLLEQLREVLPALHARLLTERSRLEAESAHVEASAAWARSASQQTR
jgi:hypothetical protein